MRSMTGSEAPLHKSEALSSASEARSRRKRACEASPFVSDGAQGRIPSAPKEPTRPKGANKGKWRLGLPSRPSPEGARIDRREPGGSGGRSPPHTEVCVEEW